MNKLKLFEEIMYSFFNIINKDNKYEKYYSINNNNGYDILKKHFIYVYRDNIKNEDHLIQLLESEEVKETVYDYINQEAGY